MNLKQASLETLIGQTRATARIHADSPPQHRAVLREIEAKLVELRDPAVSLQLAARPAEQERGAAA